MGQRSESVVEWFRREADATPIVLLHGFTGATASWRAIAGLLRGSVAAIHLPGHHPAAPVADSFLGNIDWLGDCLGAEGITRAHLVGYSLGARSALALAVTRPALAESVTLIGGHPGLRTERQRTARRLADTRWVELLRSGGIEAFTREWASLQLFASQRDADPGRVAEQQRIRRAHDAEALARSLETMGLAEMPDYSASIDDVDVPLRFVVGARDEKFRGIAHDLAHDDSGIELRVVDGVGHNVPLEAPEELAAYLTSS